MSFVINLLPQHITSQIAGQESKISLMATDGETGELVCLDRSRRASATYSICAMYVNHCYNCQELADYKAFQCNKPQIRGSVVPKAVSGFVAKG